MTSRHRPRSSRVSFPASTSLKSFRLTSATTMLDVADPSSLMILLARSPAGEIRKYSIYAQLSITLLKLVRLGLVLGRETAHSGVGSEHRPWYLPSLGDQLSDHLVVRSQVLFLLQLVQQLEGSRRNLYARGHGYTHST